MKGKDIILIAGGVGFGKTAQIERFIAEHNLNVVVLPKNPVDVVINGIGYNVRPARLGVNLEILQNMVGIRTKPLDMPAYNLVKEFELIQAKKSMLTRSQRNYVENQFYKIYEKE